MLNDRNTPSLFLFHISASFTYMNQPIIVVGMHRSGTTMLVNVLESLGVFMGQKYGVNKEAFCYMRRNEWILQRIGGAWDNIKNLDYLYGSERLQQSLIDILSEDVTSRRYKEYRDYIDSSQMWGWKDPRGLLLLQTWNKVYPNAKIIFVVRNGVDVALSLSHRANKELGLGRDVFTPFSNARKIINVVSGMDTFSLQSARCLDLDASYSLWEEYNNAIDLNDYNDDKLHVIKYEDFLVDPNLLDGLIEFLKIHNDEETSKKIFSQFKPDSANRYRLSQKGLVLHEKVAGRKMMQKWGY